jgi:hypothetical protein
MAAQLPAALEGIFAFARRVLYDSPRRMFRSLQSSCDSYANSSLVATGSAVQTAFANESTGRYPTAIARVILGQKNRCSMLY